MFNKNLLKSSIRYLYYQFLKPRIDEKSNSFTYEMIDLLILVWSK